MSGSFLEALLIMNNYDLRDKISDEDPLLQELISKISRPIPIRSFLEKRPDGSFYNFGWMPSSQGIYFSITLPRIAHEIAHALEINDRRMLLKDFGMPFGKPRSGREWFIAVAREARVRAIEQRINNQYDIWNPLDNQAWKEVLNYLPFGRFRSDKDLVEWAHDMGKGTMSSWTRERIHFEFSRKAIVLNDFVESI